MVWTSYHGQLILAGGLALAAMAVFLAAGYVVARAVVGKIVGAAAPKRFRRVRWVVVALAAAGLACLAYGYFIEPFWLEVTTVRIETPKLPANARPIRLVHVSDLHCEDEPRLEERLVQAVAELKPDLIAFTGDAANSRAGLTHFRRCMRRLVAIAPVFAVQGNWDRWQGFDDYVADTGAVDLAGGAATIDVAGRRVILIGAAAGNWPAVEAAMPTAPPEAFTIVLYHYPDKIPAAAEAGADLVLAGHTHGGQVALPFYGAVVTLSATGKRFEAGLYRLGETYAYVSRGIGCEGGWVPRIRFLARPEVTLIEIVGAPR